MLRCHLNSDIVIDIENEPNYFDLLPTELIAQIFSRLDEESIAEMSLVCKRFFFIIINHADLILFERLSQELRLPMSKHLLARSLLYWDLSNKTALMPPHLPQLLKSKQYSPLKINSFFRQRNYLAQQGELALHETELSEGNNGQEFGRLCIRWLLPTFLGYLTGSHLFFIIGVITGLTFFSRGLYEGMERDTSLHDKTKTNVLAIPSLYRSALRPHAISYDEGTLNLIKKYS